MITTPSVSRKRLLIVGPQPPPLGGGTLSVKILLDELAKYSEIKTITINTSPCSYRKKSGLLKLETLNRIAQILNEYFHYLRQSDAVLLFATHSFIFTLGSCLLILSRLCQVSFFIKPLGAEMGEKMKNHTRLIRGYMLFVLHAAAGVLAQTRQMQAQLEKLGCNNIYYLPGYRTALRDKCPKRNSREFRIIFLSQIVREKGPLVLLKALQHLNQEDKICVVCDFYGPIFEEDRSDFLNLLESTPGAKYCGMAEAGTASQLMAEYDTLVFPTCFVTEGHPGVVIEAMQAGIPVITTQYQAVTELIIDGYNGLLIPIGDSHALASAIKGLALDCSLRERMGKANFQMGKEFRSDVVVAQMLKIIFP